jgi:hypothetical protein
VDECQHDRETLTACSLVCRGWVPRSRYHLFKRVVLDATRISRTLQFLEILQSSLGTVAPFITHLCVIYYNQTPLMSRPCTQGPDHDSERRSAILKNLIALTSLTLTSPYGTMTTLTSENHSKFLSCFKNITVLNIQFINFRECRTIVDVISSFPSLESLSLHEVSWSQTELCASKPLGLPPCPPGLRYLLIGGSYPYENVLGWISASRSMETLKSVRFRNISIVDLDGIREFLGTLGSTLLQLELDFLGGESLTDGASCVRTVFQINSHILYGRCCERCRPWA